MLKSLWRIIVSTALSVASAAHAGNIDVSTIPPRDSVQLTIYNSEDITLVRETRSITFKKGVNPLQFSWANTLIDPSSVDLQFVSNKGDLELLDTTYPHGRPQSLEWSIQSDMDGAATVQITYFTSGITWAADYVCISDAAEERMSFEGFVRVFNNSGEDYADAQVRLVVGTINLVERVADLARRGIISQEEAGQFMDRAAGERPAAPMPAAGRTAMSEMVSKAEGAKQIVKEGLSEYFIYTVEGAETVASGWSKRMRLFEGKSTPFAVKYRWRPREYGEQLVRVFLLRNDETSGLGTTPLPDGIVRLFKDNARDGLSFLSAQAAKYVPIGQEIEMNLGRDPEVIHEQVRLRSWRDAFWFRRGADNRFFSPTEGDRIEPSYEMAGWDEHASLVERIRNYTGKPIEVEMRLSFPGDAVFSSRGLGAALHDFQTVQFTTTVGAGEKKELAYDLTNRQGHNAKQNAVALEEK
jgi:hypothetical protein